MGRGRLGLRTGAAGARRRLPRLAVEERARDPVVARAAALRLAVLPAAAGRRRRDACPCCAPPLEIGVRSLLRAARFVTGAAGAAAARRFPRRGL